MKTFLPFDTMSLHCDSGSRHDFPRLARESGFSFNLYRGRVDWTKIGAIDVDKIVRERDLETLQDVISSVMSCSLSSEYDLKVLDPNFIKIFQLAQLGADFLLYCRNYLDHCVTVMQEQLRVALQEIEHLQKLKVQNAEEITVLQRKLKAKSKISKPTTSSPVPMFKCAGCDKVFVGELYLLAHQQRRHPELSTSYPLVDHHSKEVESLKQQVHELQDRLRATEDALKQKQDTVVPAAATFQAMLQDELQKIKSVIAPTQNLNVKGQESESSHLQPEQSEGKVSKASDKQPQLLGTNSSTNVIALNTKYPILEEPNDELKEKLEEEQAILLTGVDQQNDEIKILREQLLEQHQTHELVMQKKLEELQRQHRADLEDLRLSISKSRGSGDHITVSSPALTSRPVETIQSPNYKETHKAWDRPAESTDSTIKRNILDGTSPSVKSKSNVAAEPTIFNAVTSPTISSMPVKAKEESVLQEDYVAPSDHESESSSETSSSPEPLKSNHQHETSVPVHLPLSKKPENADVLDHSKSMYGKSSSSGSGSSSETGSSSYDSDSQSSTSEQQHSIKENDGGPSRLQLAPQILSGLKEDLLGLLNRRLRELGVDPEWNELPVASFHSNLSTVKHHQNIAAKAQTSYFKIQEELLREVDRRVAEHLKSHQSPSTSVGIKKKKTSGSFSIFARIKSHVKNKLSHSDQSSVLKNSPKSARPSKTAELLENEYSHEPSTSTSKSSHEYEVLQERNLPLTPSKEADSESSHDADIVSSKPTNPSTVIYENMRESENSGTSGASSDVKVYSRSMYANLNRSEIEIEKKESAPQSTLKQPPQLQTSTPIKSGSTSLSQEMVKKPTFVSSDIESISELESDLNDILENTSVKPATQRNASSHRTLSTAELLANVAKFRQSAEQNNSNQSIVKSNLKSSLSTGNIMKKKVVFRDEKDGFDTIELGPAHSSYESLTPQRSHSENSLAVTYTSPLNSDHPVPQPRSNLTPATLPTGSTSTANNDSDGDWDWDNESSETLTIQKDSQGSLPEAGKFGSSATKGSNWDSSSLVNKQWTENSTDSSNVASLVKNIETKLQAQVRRPSFGVNIGGIRPSAMSSTDNYASTAEGNSGSKISFSAGNLNSNKMNKSLPEDRLLDLLLDDVSSS